MCHLLYLYWLMGKGIAYGSLSFPGTVCPLPDVANICFIWNVYYMGYCFHNRPSHKDVSIHNLFLKNGLDKFLKSSLISHVLTKLGIFFVIIWFLDLSLSLFLNVLWYWVSICCFPIPVFPIHLLWNSIWTTFPWAWQPHLIFRGNGFTCWRELSFLWKNVSGLYENNLYWIFYRWDT